MSNTKKQRTEHGAVPGIGNNMNVVPQQLQHTKKAPEFELPVASIVRLVKRRLPKGDNVSVGRDAKLAFQKAAGIFIMYLTYCATDFCKQHHRSTISATDVFDALNELEFDEYIEPLKECLQHFRKNGQAKKEEKKKRDAVREEERKKVEGGGSNVAEQSASSSSSSSASSGQ